MTIVRTLFLSSLSSTLSPLMYFHLYVLYLAVVMVSFQDLSYSGAEGSSVNVCAIAGPADKAFGITLSTIQDTASAG
jgi:hypothetical protein